MFIKTSCSFNTSTMLPHNHLPPHKDTRGSNAPQNTPPGSHLTAPRRGRRRPHIQTPGWGSPRSPAESSGGERWARGAPTSRGGGAAGEPPPWLGLCRRGGFAPRKSQHRSPGLGRAVLARGRFGEVRVKIALPGPSSTATKPGQDPGWTPPPRGAFAAFRAPPLCSLPPHGLKTGAGLEPGHPWGAQTPRPPHPHPRFWGARVGG